MNQLGSSTFSLLNTMQEMGHEQVVYCTDPETGLNAIIAIHDTTLGPSLGGVRMWPYASEADALKDVLRLSRGMTYKSAVSGLDLGGGKAVILGNPAKDKSQGLFRSFGRYVDGLNGRYVTAEDVGMTEVEMDWISETTRHVTGKSKENGGMGAPSPITAFGVYMGMKAAAKQAYGSDSLAGKKVAIQGAGHVAEILADYLAKEDAILFISDIFEEKSKAVADRAGAQIIAPDAIFDVDADIFSPNALGAVINDESIPRLRCSVIAGGANNVLDDPLRHGRDLQERGILYAPDYVVNAGGIMHVYGELVGESEGWSMKRAESIYDTTLRVFQRAEEKGITPAQASDLMAEERIQAARAKSK